MFRFPLSDRHQLKERYKMSDFRRLLPFHVFPEEYKTVSYPESSVSLANILPHLTYCSMVWHFIRSSDKRELERLQEKGLRAVFKDKSSSYEDLQNKAKLVTLNNQRLQNIAILMFKVKHGICPTYISDLFNLQTTQ